VAPAEALLVLSEAQVETAVRQGLEALHMAEAWQD
jgi:hypothetical protein